MGHHDVDDMVPPSSSRPTAPAFCPVLSARAGRRLPVSVDGPVTPEILEAAAAAAEQVLSNPVIEDVVRVADIEADAAATVTSQGLA